MTRPPRTADSGESRTRQGTDDVDTRRAVGGGLAVLGAVLGFTLVRAVIETGGFPDRWVLVALPAFGLVGVVGFVVLVSAVVHR